MSESAEKQSSNQETGYKIKAGLFLATAGGIGLLAGFAGAIGIVKKQDPESFDKVWMFMLFPPDHFISNGKKSSHILRAKLSNSEKYLSNRERNR